MSWLISYFIKGIFNHSLTFIAADKTIYVCRGTTKIELDKLILCVGCGPVAHFYRFKFRPPPPPPRYSNSVICISIRKHMKAVNIGPACGSWIEIYVGWVHSPPSQTHHRRGHTGALVKSTICSNLICPLNIVKRQTFFEKLSYLSSLPLVHTVG